MAGCHIFDSAAEVIQSQMKWSQIIMNFELEKDDSGLLYGIIAAVVWMKLTETISKVSQDKR